MSIKIMSRVWEESDARLGARLVLLALADFSNDAGISWPSVETLAQKSRLSERQVQRILRELVSTGDITIDENAGPKGCHLYRVIVRGDNMSPRQNSGGDKHDTKGVTNRAEGVTNRAENVSEMSPEPSLTTIEPSNEPSVGKTRRKATRISDDFEPDENTMIWMSTEGFTMRDLERELPKFIDYWAGNGKTMVDWQRTFKNWLRNGRDRGWNGGSKTTKPTPTYYKPNGGLTAEGMAAKVRGEIK